MSALARFLKPETVAVYGGSWAKNVIQQLKKSDFAGDIWPVHPSRVEIDGIACFAGTQFLPGAPDAAFIGVNRELTIDVVQQLKEAGAGGAICFASGFREASHDHHRSLGVALNDEPDLQDRLVDAAGAMPLLGPNCYGYLNYLDNVTLWPDQHGGQPVERGVAIIAQSSNVAINLTMQQRGLSIAAMCTVGNQACVSLTELAEHFIADPRVSSLGLFIEGFGDIRVFEAMSKKARAAGKCIVALKLGKSRQSQQATLSHTATLAGGAVASSAFLKRLGIVEVNSVSGFIETLKILDVLGPISGNRIASVSCSGGEASLMSDAVVDTNLIFPEFSQVQRDAIGMVLGDKVALANPLDYHTYVWGDVAKMTACFTAVMRGEFDLNVFVLDMPRAGICDTQGHQCAIDSIIAAAQTTGAKVAVLASLPENMNEAVTRHFHSNGVVVLHGLEEGLVSIQAAVNATELAQSCNFAAVFLGELNDRQNLKTLSESRGKTLLSSYGVPIPLARIAAEKNQISSVARSVPYPVVLKGLGIAHKSDSGAVILNIRSDTELAAAVSRLPNCDDGYLIEQMVDKPVAEVIVGVTKEPTGMLLLTIGAGGVLTEILSDSVSLLMPASKADIESAIASLNLNAILQGYRGKASGSVSALVGAIIAIQVFVKAHADVLEELDINPIIVREHDVVAVDVLIRQRNN